MASELSEERRKSLDAAYEAKLELAETEEVMPLRNVERSKTIKTSLSMDDFAAARRKVTFGDDPAPDEDPLRKTKSDTELLSPSALRRTTSLPSFVEYAQIHKYDLRQLEADEPDLYRVQQHLARRFDETYSLYIVFVIRNAVELHRAWHMTLLTSKLCQQIKDTFGLRMTWELGVLRLKFRIEDGDYELHRKVPYDYDSEYQDKYMRLAKALMAGSLDVHRALTYQTEIKEGLHTARSGIFLRTWPGRILLYPLVASTCTGIFFGGDWDDAIIAAVCGIATGVVEWTAGKLGRSGAVTMDALVGFVVGIITGFVYNRADTFYSGGHCLPAVDDNACAAVTALDDSVACDAVGEGVCTYLEDKLCMSSILMGTLYWFFYGTAFVIGLLEIICGELETGVTRFVAVSVKTFVLCLGASFGLMCTLDETLNMWNEQQGQCGLIDLREVWWRIPLYLFCSATVLGQYRFPVRHYWRGLIVQLAAYEVQYEVQLFFQERHLQDNLDYALSNTAGAVAGVLVACTLAFLVETMCHRPYQRRVVGLRRREDDTRCNHCIFTCCRHNVACLDCLGIGRKNDLHMAKMGKDIATAAKGGENARFVVPQEHEHVYVEAIVELESHNVWAVLMPAVYQLVPGSMIAKLWFNTLFPPDVNSEDFASKNNTYANLMVIATSLAIGLILGFSTVSLFQSMFVGQRKHHVFVPW